VLMKRRTAGRAHVSLRSPVTVNAVQESILLGRIEIGDTMLYAQLESGSEAVELVVPLSNVAGIQWESQGD